MNHNAHRDQANRFGFDYCTECDKPTPIADLGPGCVCIACELASCPHLPGTEYRNRKQPAPQPERPDSGERVICPHCGMDVWAGAQCRSGTCNPRTMEPDDTDARNIAACAREEITLDQLAASIAEEPERFVVTTYSDVFDLERVYGPFATKDEAIDYAREIGPNHPHVFVNADVSLLDNADPSAIVTKTALALGIDLRADTPEPAQEHAAHITIVKDIPGRYVVYDTTGTIIAAIDRYVSKPVWTLADTRANIAREFRTLADAKRYAMTYFAPAALAALALLTLGAPASAAVLPDVTACYQTGATYEDGSYRIQCPLTGRAYLWDNDGDSTSGRAPGFVETDR